MKFYFVFLFRFDATKFYFVFLFRFDAKKFYFVLMQPYKHNLRITVQNT